MCFDKTNTNNDKKNHVHLALCIFAVYGCNYTKASENASELDVSFEWTKKSDCSNISPAIIVDKIPNETKGNTMKLFQIWLNLPAEK